MNHQVRPRAALRTVVGIGVADVERQVIVRPLVHLRGPHRIEPFWRLPVALGEFRAELARPFADIIVAR